MTCKERLKLDHPYYVGEHFKGGAMRCPHAYGYLPQPKAGADGVCVISCDDCWNREIPGSNPTETVNHPDHYTRENAMECIDEMVLVFGAEATMHFCLLNAWKYRYRAADKNGAEDLKKSDWYMRLYHDLLMKRGGEDG